MHTTEVKWFSFDELDDEAKAKALADEEEKWQESDSEWDLQCLFENDFDPEWEALGFIFQSNKYGNYLYGPMFCQGEDFKPDPRSIALDEPEKLFAAAGVPWLSDLGRLTRKYGLSVSKVETRYHKLVLEFGEEAWNEEYDLSPLEAPLEALCYKQLHELRDLFLDDRTEYHTEELQERGECFDRFGVIDWNQADTFLLG